MAEKFFIPDGQSGKGWIDSPYYSDPIGVERFERPCKSPDLNKAQKIFNNMNLTFKPI
jgi:hypothetical protein